MAVAAGNTSEVGANTNNLQWLHTLGTGSDLVLVVCLALGSGVTASAVAWDFDGVDEALTMLRRDTNAGDATTEIWYLVGPSAATGSSVISATLSSMAQSAGSAVTFTGATTPDNATGASTDGVSSSSLTISAAGDDDYLVDVIRHSSAAAISEGADQTRFMNQATGGDRSGASHQDGAVSGDVMSWSWSGNTNPAHTACRIPAAGGGPATTPGHPIQRGIRHGMGLGIAN